MRPIGLDWKRLPRRVRDTPALNAPITTTLRAGCRVLRQPAPEWLVVHAPRVGLATSRLPNGRPIALACGEPEIMTNALFWRGWPASEPELLPLWFAAAEQAATVIDVGAHVGQHAITAALANPRATVLAFEALPRTAAALRANIRLNRCANITVVEAAAGREAGSARFWSVEGGLPSSSGLAEDFISGHGSALEETVVAVVDLDSAVPEARTPVLLKVDTETTEPDVLAGAARLLDTARPMVFVEVLAGHGVAARLNALIDGLGYRPYLLTEGGVLARPAVVEDARWRNYLLAPTVGPSAVLTEVLSLPA